VRILLIGALVATLVGCSHQPPSRRATTDSCASRNPLACWMSVRVPIEPASPTTHSATPRSQLQRKAQTTAVPIAP